MQNSRWHILDSQIKLAVAIVETNMKGVSVECSNASNHEALVAYRDRD